MKLDLSLTTYRLTARLQGRLCTVKLILMHCSLVAHVADHRYSIKQDSRLPVAKQCIGTVTFTQINFKA